MERVWVTEPVITNLKDKKRTHKVEFRFKTTTNAPYKITLKMGKGLNNINCEYRYTNLNNLTLYEENNLMEAKVNLAQEYTYASGNVSWSDNSDAYDIHIDR